MIGYQTFLCYPRDGPVENSLLFIQFILKFAHGFLFSFQRFFFINVKFFFGLFNACLLYRYDVTLFKFNDKNTKVAINPATIRKNNVLKTFFKLKSK
jgi:hypothetical protein